MRFGGIVVIALLSLGACSSDPEPREPQASATPTPTVTAPTMPPQAKQDSPEGAAAFVKHYVDVFNYASSTGDTTELQRLSAPRCVGCQRYIKLFADTYDAGGYFKDDGWNATRVDARVSGEGFVVDLDVQAPETRYRTDRASEEKIGEAGQYNLRLGVVGPNVVTFKAAKQ